MRCPYCNTDNDRVVDSRSASDGKVIRRRRECLNCMRRFTTYERMEEAPLRVIKKDGSRVAFDREKVLSGLHRACEKRSVSQEQLDQLIRGLEEEIEKHFDREVPSSFLGETIMERLRELDQVAYVRFASVYREFKDAEDFQREIQDISRSSI